MTLINLHLLVYYFRYILIIFLFHNIYTEKDNIHAHVKMFQTADQQN